MRIWFSTYYKKKMLAKSAGFRYNDCVFKMAEVWNGAVCHCAVSYTHLDVYKRQQLMAWTLGGKVTPCTASEYGKTAMTVDTENVLFKGLDRAQVGLMSHCDQITELPEGFVNAASTQTCPNAAMTNAARRLYATQFHPEVESTPNGTAIIRNFLYGVCGAAGDYNLHDLETVSYTHLPFSAAALKTI